MYEFQPADEHGSACHVYANETFSVSFHIQPEAVLVTVVRLGEAPETAVFTVLPGELAGVADEVARQSEPVVVRPDSVVSGRPVLVLYPAGKPFEVAVIRFSDERWVEPGQGYRGYLLQAAEVAHLHLGEDMRELARRLAPD